MTFHTRWLLVLLGVVALATTVGAEPPVRLSEDGTVFLYRAQPGDLPGAVAERFGIRDLPAFLAANGIADPSRVASGHVYRIPNPLAERAFAAEARAAELGREAEAAGARARTRDAEVATLTAKLDALERRPASLARLARLWPWIQVLGVACVLLLVASGYVTYRSMRELREAEGHARRLTDELDQRRRVGLAERQESARRILDLENEVHALTLANARAAAHRRPTGTH